MDLFRGPSRRLQVLTDALRRRLLQHRPGAWGPAKCRPQCQLHQMPPGLHMRLEGGPQAVGQEPRLVAHRFLAVPPPGAASPAGTRPQGTARRGRRPRAGTAAQAAQAGAAGRWPLLPAPRRRRRRQEQRGCAARDCPRRGRERARSILPERARQRGAPAAALRLRDHTSATKAAAAPAPGSHRRRGSRIQSARSSRQPS